MSTDQSTNLGLPFLMPAQAQKHVTVNESLLRLDALVQAAAESRSVAAQPGAPADGALWILPPGKTGPEWGGYANWSIAYHRDGVWETIAPKVGWRFFLKDEGVWAHYTGSVWTADVVVGSLNGGPLGGFRNAVINGGFDVWQRGTSFASASYGADRWHASVAHSRQTDVPGGEGFAASLQFGDASPVATIARQRIEAGNALPLAGKPAALSFWAKSTAGSASLYAEISSAGAADDFSAPTVRHSQVFAASNPSTSWTRYSLLVGALHADCANGIQLVIGRGSASAATTRIAGVQLEPGGAVTPFERRPLGLELALCQRYFAKTYDIEIPPGAVNGAGVVGCIVDSSGAASWNWRYPVYMRVAPSIVTYNPATGAVGTYRDNTGANPATVLVAYGKGGVHISGSGGAAGAFAWVHAAASADL